MSISKKLQEMLAKVKGQSKAPTAKPASDKSVQIKGNVEKSTIILGDGNIVCHIHLLDRPDREEQLTSALSLADLHGLSNLRTVEPDGSESSLSIERQADLLRQYRQQLGLKDRVMGGKIPLSQRPLPRLYRCSQQASHPLEIVFDDKAPLCPVCHGVCVAV
jgi:hypothetical protein